MLPNQLVIW